jgi:hypothetical protein
MSDDADKTQDRLELEDAIRRKEMDGIKYIKATGSLFKLWHET